MLVVVDLENLSLQWSKTSCDYLVFWPYYSELWLSFETHNNKSNKGQRGQQSVPMAQSNMFCNSFKLIRVSLMFQMCLYGNAEYSEKKKTTVYCFAVTLLAQPRHEILIQLTIHYIRHKHAKLHSLSTVHERGEDLGHVHAVSIRRDRKNQNFVPKWIMDDLWGLSTYNVLLNLHWKIFHSTTDISIIKIQHLRCICKDFLLKEFMVNFPCNFQDIHQFYLLSYLK